MADLHVTGVTQLDGLATILGGEQVAGPIPKLQLSSVSLGGAPVRLQIQGRYAYVINFSSGSLQIVDVASPAALVLTGSVSLGGGPDGVDVQGRYAYVAGGAPGLQVVDVASPTAPSLVGTVSLGGSAVRIYIQGRYAFVSNFSSGSLQVVDIASPTAPALVGTASLGGSPVRVQIQGRYAYVSNESGSLQVVDIASPTAPALVGTASLGGIPYDVCVQGRYVYVANYSLGSLQVVDIASPTAPALVGSVSLGGAVTGVHIQGRYAYVSNGSLGSLQIVDVTSSTAPLLVGAVLLGGISFDVYVQGRYAYVANGAGSLQIVDVGGSYIQQLEAGGGHVTTLVVENKVSAMDGSFSGGLSVGKSLRVDGEASASNIGTASALASDTDTALAANSDSRVATQKATKAYADTKAPIASPTLTGVPAAPTAAVDTNTTQLSTTAFVIAQLSASGDGVPVIDGTAARGTSTHGARADHVHPTDTSRAPLASPALTGTPTAPTAAVDTNTTQVATTAMVLAQAASANPAMNGAVAVGTSTRYARADHVHATDTSLAPLASPTFTTQITDPLVIGGTGTTSTLKLRSTSGVGAAGADIVFQVGNNGATEALRILNSGSVGVGTASPQALLDVRGSNAHSLVGSGTTDFLGGSQTGFGASNGTEKLFFAVQSNLAFLGSNSNTDLGFITNNSTKMRLDAAGNLGIGMVPTKQLELSTDSAQKPTTNTWTITSDRRVKKDIRPYTKGLDAALSIRPVEYHFNGKGVMPDEAEDSPFHVSVIAQDLLETLPELVGHSDGEIDGEKTDVLSYLGHDVTFICLNAIRELKEQNDALRARISTLESKMV